MGVLPDQGDLYPEVTAAGDLGAALGACAAAQGLSFPAITSRLEPRHLVSVPSTLAHRRDLRVRGSAWGRTWSVYGHEAGRELLLLDGETQDLAPLARLAHAWHDGTPLGDLAAVAPFVRLTGRFEVPDNNPARLTESEWQCLLTAAAAREDWPEWLALVSAAAAEPCFRRLYPHNHTWFLEFATTTRPAPPGGGLVAVGVAEGGGTTVVTEWGGAVVGEFPTAAEAVAEAVRHLPGDLGPVTYAPRDPDRSFPRRG